MKKILAVTLPLLLLVAYAAYPFGGSVSVNSNATSGAATLAVTDGGTGVATSTAHGVLMGEGTSAIAASAAGTTGQPFVSGGASADGAYAVLGVVGGGSGLATATAHGVLLGEATSAFAVTAAGTTGWPLVSGGASADGAYALLGVVGGGTGAATETAHGLLLGQGTSPVTAIAPVAAGQVLASGSATTDPAFSANPIVASITAQGPTAQAIAGGNRIVADTCGGMKQVTAAGGVSTDATDPFTISTTTTNGCVMALCNVSGGANTITVKHSAGHFISQGGADVALAQNTCVWVGNDGTLWRQLSSLQTDS